MTMLREGNYWILYSLFIPLLLFCGFGGDFNIIRSMDKKQGGARPQSLAMREFNNCIDDCGMNDVLTMGAIFIWCNGREGDRCI